MGNVYLYSKTFSRSPLFIPPINRLIEGEQHRTNKTGGPVLQQMQIPFIYKSGATWRRHKYNKFIIFAKYFMQKSNLKRIKNINQSGSVIRASFQLNKFKWFRNVESSHFVPTMESFHWFSQI